MVLFFKYVDLKSEQLYNGYLESFLLFHQEEQRYEQRKRTLLILILHHLREEG